MTLMVRVITQLRTAIQPTIFKIEINRNFYVTLFLWLIIGRSPYIELYEVDGKMTGDE